MYKNFYIDSHNYTIFDDGSIKQVNPTEFTYTSDYIDRYNQFDPILTYKLNDIRINIIKNFIEGGRLLEVGYGNGSFLKKASECFESFGYDVVDGFIPSGIKFCKNWKDQTWDIACFFDVIEHMNDLDWLENFNANYIIISLPYCHLLDGGDFKNWKHRKPNEHIWHFNDESLIKKLLSYDFKCIYTGYDEDVVRVDPSLSPNILTCVFKKLSSEEKIIKRLSNVAPLIINSHGGVSTNYLLDTFKIRDYVITASPHIPTPLSSNPTIFVYGDFLNSIESQENRGILKYNVTKLKEDIIFNEGDPLGFKNQIINHCNFSNVALLNYNTYSQEHMDIICNRFNLPKIQINKINRNTIYGSDNYPEYDVPDSLFPPLAFGRTDDSNKIKNILKYI